VLDVFLQILDAARVTMASGDTLDFSNHYIVLTSNIGAAEILHIQHSTQATMERHVLTRAQQSLRPEILRASPRNWCSTGSRMTINWKSRACSWPAN